jgi:hypothetical protein
LAESRRQDRQSTPRLDARTVLYGRVADFIVAECVAARMAISPGSPWAPPEGWSLVALPERAKAGQGVEAADAVAEIHARWLMTPRDDLGGRCPRDVLLDKREHLEWDLQDRCQQWSMLGQCPPPLGEETAAFRLGGMGTHENIVYYDLVRWLIGECWQRVVEPVADDAASAEPQAGVLPWLRQVQDDWLNEPNWEDFSGRTPAEVIRDERRRIPMAMSGKEAMVDDDCPLCQMLGESTSPVFWHLDGCNMDEDFPFSICQRTRQQWEEEQRRHEEFTRKFEEEYKCRRAVLESELPGSEPRDGLRRADDRLEDPAGRRGACGIARPLLRQRASGVERPVGSASRTGHRTLLRGARRGGGFPPGSGDEMRRPGTSTARFRDHGVGRRERSSFLTFRPRRGFCPNAIPNDPFRK